MRLRAYRISIVILAALLVVLLPSACSRSQDQPSPEGEEPAAQETDLGQSQDAEVIYTRDDPGAYGGKEDSHVPVITFEKSESGLTVAVSVNHEMNTEKPHFIEWIQLKDGRGRLLGERRFQAEENRAEAVFELTRIPDLLVAFEKCNIHGIWKEEIDTN